MQATSQKKNAGKFSIQVKLRTNRKVFTAITIKRVARFRQTVLFNLGKRRY